VYKYHKQIPSVKNTYLGVFISKVVMNDVRASQLVISKTLSVSPARKLRSVPGFPHISPWEMYHARPALLTVFSTTQLEHLIS